MYLLVLLFPLLGFLQAFFGGFFFGRFLSSVFSVIFLVFSFVISVYIFFEVSFHQCPVVITFFSWLTYQLFSVYLGLFFDQLTSAMLVVITAISAVVHLYSMEYMGHDPFLSRFLSYLSLFTFFMIFLVTSDNFVQLFIGWEGVGLCSYLLINFWFTRVLANKAAIKAMLMNRIADVLFVFAVGLMLLFFGSCTFPLVFLSKNFEFFFLPIGAFSIKVIDALCLFLFLGAIGKSAQIGFHTWLPDAMEGPTPVSSLLHAATMVTAGVFLVLRCSILFEESTFFLVILAFFGGITAFFSAFIALFQWDLKKVIAYSTCSQLGYMFLSCGLSFYSVALFHLFNHAFFKALLFLSAGSVIHALGDEQDMRRMGATGRFLPFTLSAIVFASFAIMGFPFLTGFYSKDLVLELVLASFQLNSFFFYGLTLIAAFFTATYSFRLLNYVFFGRLHYNFGSLPKESGQPISYALLSLALASVVVGYIFSDFFVGWGVFSSLDGAYALTDILPFALSLSPWQRNLPLYLSLVGVVLATLGLFLWRFLIPRLGFLSIHRGFSSFFFHSGFFNYMYNRWYNTIYFSSYGLTTKFLDKGLLEYLGPVGFYRLMYWLSISFRSLPSFVFFQIGSMVFGITFWIGFLLIGINYTKATLALVSWVFFGEFGRSI